MKKEAEKAQSLQKQLNIFKQSVSIFNLDDLKRSSFLHIFFLCSFEKQV